MLHIRKLYPLELLLLLCYLLLPFAWAVLAVGEFTATQMDNSDAWTEWFWNDLAERRIP